MTRVISADCHINEPPWVFDRLPAQYRDRAPRMLRGDDGGDGWSFDGKPPKRTFGVEAMAGRAKADYQASGLRFEDILPGNYDGAAHVSDMELDGIDVSIVYPAQAIFTYMEPDRGLAIACMQSYNDWLLEDFQAQIPSGSSVCHCCRSRTASTSASPNSTGCWPSARRQPSSPAARPGRTTTRITSRSGPPSPSAGCR